MNKGNRIFPTPNQYEKWLLFFFFRWENPRSVLLDSSIRIIPSFLLDRAQKGAPAKQKTQQILTNILWPLNKY